MAVRRALFSKPAWAAKAPDNTEPEQPTSIFQQNVYEDILQEQRKKEERKTLKQKAKGKQPQRSDSETRATRSDNGERVVKKRRISKTPIDLEEEEEENEDDDFDKSASGSGSDSDHDTTKNAHQKTKHATSSETQRPSTRTTRAKQQALPDVPDPKSPNHLEDDTVYIPDDDDDDLIICDPTPKDKIPGISPPPPPQAATKTKPPPPPPESEPSDSDPDEDEHIKSLKRKARHEARLKNLHATTVNTNTSIDPTLPPSTSTLNPSSQDQSQDQVQIYIQTILPSCPPLGIIRRPSQTLESVHTHFCNTHALSDNLRSKVFFTWNNQRLYKTTTARSILDQIRRKNGGIDKSGGRIVIEAVTEEIFEHRVMQRERERRRAEQGDMGGGMDEATGDSAPPLVGVGMSGEAPGEPATDVPAASGVVIKLTNPKFALMQLRVHAHTTIERIVRGYKKRMNVDMDKEAYLVFEGERLDEGDTVGDVGFENEDVVDVRVG